jgi:hypothetical protein
MSSWLQLVSFPNSWKIRCNSNQSCSFCSWFKVFKGSLKDFKRPYTPLVKCRSESKIGNSPNKACCGGASSAKFVNFGHRKTCLSCGMSKGACFGGNVIDDEQRRGAGSNGLKGGGGGNAEISALRKELGQLRKQLGAVRHEGPIGRSRDADSLASGDAADEPIAATGIATVRTNIVFYEKMLKEATDDDGRNFAEQRLAGLRKQLLDAKPAESRHSAVGFKLKRARENLARHDERIVASKRELGELQAKLSEQQGQRAALHVDIAALEAEFASSAVSTAPEQFKGNMEVKLDAAVLDANPEVKSMLEGEAFAKFQTLCQNAAKAPGGTLPGQGSTTVPTGAGGPMRAAEKKQEEADSDEIILGEDDIDEDMLKCFGGMQSKRDLLNVFEERGFRIKRPRKGGPYSKPSG